MVNIVRTIKSVSLKGLHPTELGMAFKFPTTSDESNEKAVAIFEKIRPGISKIELNFMMFLDENYGEEIVKDSFVITREIYEHYLGNINKEISRVLKEAKVKIKTSYDYDESITTAKSSGNRSDSFMTSTLNQEITKHMNKTRKVTVRFIDTDGLILNLVFDSKFNFK